MSDVESDSTSTRDAFEFILDSSKEESDQHHDDKNFFNGFWEAITVHDHYFVRKRDGIGRIGPSGLVKMTASLRTLSYGCLVDSSDEWLKIGESIVLESLRYFCSAGVAVFGEEYLSSPNQQDIRRLLSTGEQQGFLGMLDSLDCMHWVWKNCPTAWHGTHMGHTKEATVILEVVADHELWIWHTFFGMAGSYND